MKMKSRRLFGFRFPSQNFFFQCKNDQTYGILVKALTFFQQLYRLSSDAPYFLVPTPYLSFFPMLLMLVHFSSRAQALSLPILPEVSSPGARVSSSRRLFLVPSPAFQRSAPALSLSLFLPSGCWVRFRKVFVLIGRRWRPSRPETGRSDCGVSPRRVTQHHRFRLPLIGSATLLSEEFILAKSTQKNWKKMQTHAISCSRSRIWFSFS